MKKLLVPLLIATQLNATDPFSSAKTRPKFNSDSVARRMLIEDAIGDGKIEIGTVEKAYGYVTPGKDLERMMWLALMKDPEILETYISNGMGRNVQVVYEKNALKIIGQRLVQGLYYSVGSAAIVSVVLLLGWMENQQGNQIIINSNGK